MGVEFAASLRQQFNKEQLLQKQNMELFKIIAIFCIFSVHLKGVSSAPYIKCNADGYCKALRIGPASIEGICSNPKGKALRRFRTYFRDIVIDCYFNEDGVQDGIRISTNFKNFENFENFEEMEEKMEKEMEEAMKEMEEEMEEANKEMEEANEEMEEANKEMEEAMKEMEEEMEEANK